MKNKYFLNIKKHLKKFGKRYLPTYIYYGKMIYIYNIWENVYV